MTKKFDYEPLTLPKLNRIHKNGMRFYQEDNPQEFQTFISITTVTSFFNRQIFAKWRKKIGEKKATEITEKAAARGTDFHTLNENYLLGTDPPEVSEMGEKLFGIAKPALDKIGKIYGIELRMFSRPLGVAGTADLIAEYERELAIIDYKSSEKPKPREWLEHYFVQAAAYSCMLYELTGLMAKKLVIIMACENGELVIYEERDMEKYIKLLIKYIKHFVENNAV
jgi:genome maintenance exonuclease 1